MPVQGITLSAGEIAALVTIIGGILGVDPRSPQCDQIERKQYFTNLAFAENGILIAPHTLTNCAKFS
jgi:hypothetical protein